MQIPTDRLSLSSTSLGKICIVFRLGGDEDMKAKTNNQASKYMIVALNVCNIEHIQNIDLKTKTRVGL